MRGPEPLTLTIELARAANAEGAFDFVFAPQSYLLRGAGGGFHNATLPWDEALLADLAAVREPGRDPVIVQRLGQRIREFLAPTEWPVMEAEVRAAIGACRPVVVTVRSGAAELYALPWELLTIEASGQHLGELPDVLIRYEWPETTTQPPSPDASGARCLLAWSGAVPAAEHEAAIRDACRAGGVPFDAERDVLPHASCGRLAEALRAATAEGKPVRTLHVLCHGTPAGSTFGLALDGDDGDGAVPVDAGRLRQLLAPHAGTLRLIVLAACDSGNAGAVGNQLGSVAQALHRAGIAAVVASRYPLSTAGSSRLARALYEQLIGAGATLDEAFIAARQHLAVDARELDWASIQLYARAGDGAAKRPSGPLATELRKAEVQHELSQFRALFGGSRSQISLLGDYKALHDVLQDVEAPFSAIVRDQKRLLASREAWEDLRDPLEELQILVEKTLQILGCERLKDEFDVLRRRLTDAGAALTAAMAGDTKKLEAAIFHVRRMLGLDLSTANNKLISTARDLRLDEVVAALRAVADKLCGTHGEPVANGNGSGSGANGHAHGAGGNGSALGELRRLIDALDELHTRLEALVREHDRWQGIGNDLRHYVDSGQAGIEEIRHSWQPVQESLAAVLADGRGADWTRVIDSVAKELDGALGRGDDPGKCVAHLRGLFRRTNQRFVDVDKQLLQTCEELRQVGDTLDTVLKVLDDDAR